MKVTGYDNMTDGYNDRLSININCTKNEKNIDIIIPTIILTILCVLSFLCLMSLMIHALIKHLIGNK